MAALTLDEDLYTINPILAASYQLVDVQDLRGKFNSINVSKLYYYERIKDFCPYDVLEHFIAYFRGILLDDKIEDKKLNLYKAKINAM